MLGNKRMNSHSTPPGIGLSYIMGQVQHTRTFATSANLKNNLQGQNQCKMGIGRTGKSILCDEGSAKVINRDNNYPNNERKTSEDMSCSDNTLFCPVVEVAHSLTIISSVRRTVSECPSEDSYVVFEGCDTELDDLDSNFDDEDDSDDSDDDIYWERDKQHKTEEADCRSTSDKKVHFPPDEQLAEVHRMIMWSFAYRACRKGHWEQYSRDRARFQRRIDSCRDEISRILDQNHREKIYQERFLPPATTTTQEPIKSQRKTYSTCGSIDEKKKNRPKRHKRRRNGKKKRKNRHKSRR